MKTLYLIGGAMGVGKTAVCQKLKQKLPNCVFLDGDWCWDAHPFQATAETKAMVLQNICFLLNQFLHCSAYDTVLFCWVLHRQDVIDRILTSLDTADCRVVAVSLVCRPDTLRRRLKKDIQNGVRTEDVIERSLERLTCYDRLDTVKLPTDGQSADGIADRILSL